MNYEKFPQWNWKPEWFDQLLNGPLAYRAIYRRAELCPCFDLRRSSPEPDCDVCEGVGYIWDEPPIHERSETIIRGGERGEQLGLANVSELVSVTYRGAPITGASLEKGEVVFTSEEPCVGDDYTVTYRAPEQGRIHAQSIKTNRQLAKRDDLQSTDMECSIPERLDDLLSPNPAFMAAEFDRFLLPDAKRRVQQRMRKGRNETLTYSHRLEITSLRYKSGSSLVRLTSDEFAISGDRIDVDIPAQTPYIVDYIASPEMYVFDEIPQVRHSGGFDLPRRVHLRLFESFPNRV